MRVSTSSNTIFEAPEVSFIMTPDAGGRFKLYISFTSPFDVNDDEPSKVVGYVDCKDEVNCEFIKGELRNQLMEKGCIDFKGIKNFVPVHA